MTLKLSHALIGLLRSIEFVDYFRVNAPGTAKEYRLGKHHIRCYQQAGIIQQRIKNGYLYDADSNGNYYVTPKGYEIFKSGASPPLVVDRNRNNTLDYVICAHCGDTPAFRVNTMNIDDGYRCSKCKHDTYVSMEDSA